MGFSWPAVITHGLLLISLGMTLEVVFTALADLPEAKDWRLLGYTYVWMVPIYALIYPGMCFIYPRIAAWPFLARGVFYAAAILIVEYISGWILRKTTGKCPWESGYLKARWGVHGLIRLDFAPGWLAASLLYEWSFRVLRGLT